MESMRIDRQNEAVSRNHKRSAQPVKEAASGKDFTTSPAELGSASKPLTSLPPGGPKPPSMLVQSFPKPPSMLKAEAEARQQAEADAKEREKEQNNATENEGDPPIPMAGDRFFNHPSAETEEIKQLPANPRNGQVVTFVYQNSDKSQSYATYTYMAVTHQYNTPGNETGRWEKGVTNTKKGSGYKEGEYVTLAEVETIKAANKDVVEKKAVETDLDNEELTKEKTIATRTGTDSELTSVDKVPVDEKNKTKADTKKTKKKEPEKEHSKEESKKEEEPPSIVSKAEFKLRDDWFEKGPSREQAYSSLREISNYLKKHPGAAFVVHIYIQASGAKASDLVGGGFFEPGPDTPYSGRPLSALAYGRFVTVQNIILTQTGLKDVSLGYVPHFNSSVHMFKVVPKK